MFIITGLSPSTLRGLRINASSEQTYEEHESSRSRPVICASDPNPLPVSLTGIVGGLAVLGMDRSGVECGITPSILS